MFSYFFLSEWGKCPAILRSDSCSSFYPELRWSPFSNWFFCHPDVAVPVEYELMKSLSVFVFHPEYVLMNLTYVIERSNLICCNKIYNCGNCRWWNCLNPNWFIYLRFRMKVNSNLHIFVILVTLLLIYFLQMSNK